MKNQWIRGGGRERERERERSEKLNILGFFNSLYLRSFWQVENVQYPIQIFSMHMRGYCESVPMHIKFYDAVRSIRSADTDFHRESEHLLFVFPFLFFYVSQ